MYNLKSHFFLLKLKLIKAQQELVTDNSKLEKHTLTFENYALTTTTNLNCVKKKANCCLRSYE